MLDRAAAMAAHVRPTHVLDLGSGSGGLSEQLLKHHEIGTVELWDIDEEMLERARLDFQPMEIAQNFQLNPSTILFPIAPPLQPAYRYIIF